MTGPIIAAVVAVIGAPIIAAVVPAVIIAMMIGVTVMAIARLRLSRNGGHGARTEQCCQSQFLQEHRSTFQSRSPIRNWGNEDGAVLNAGFAAGFELRAARIIAGLDPWRSQ